MSDPQLNYNHLYYFHVVASEGSLAAASRELGVTQPTISEQIRTLEDTLGSRLFDRSSGRLRLNEAGRLLHRETTAMFRIGHRISRRFGNGYDEPREVLMVGVSSSVGRSFAADYLLPLFHDEEAVVRLRDGDYAYMIRDLLAWELELVLADELPENPEERGLVVRTLRRSPMVVLSAVGTETAPFPGIFERHGLMHYLPGTRRRFDLDQYLLGQGLTAKVYGETNDIGLMLSATRANHCICVVPQTAIGGAVEREELRVVGELPAPEAEVYAIYHAKETPARVSAAIERLVGANGPV